MLWIHHLAYASSNQFHSGHAKSLGNKPYTIMDIQIWSTTLGMSWEGEEKRENPNLVDGDDGAGVWAGGTTGGACFAEGRPGPRQRPKTPRQSLCRGPFIGHSAKPLSRARTALGKEKKPSGVGAVGGFFAEGRPSANKFFYFFLKKPLPRASSLALGKEIFRIF